MFDRVVNTPLSFQIHLPGQGQVFIGILLNGFSEKFRNVSRKTPAME